MTPIFFYSLLLYSASVGASNLEDGRGYVLKSCLFLAAQTSSATVVCIAGQCLEGFSNTTSQCASPSSLNRTDATPFKSVQSFQRQMSRHQYTCCLGLTLLIRTPKSYMMRSHPHRRPLISHQDSRTLQAHPHSAYRYKSTFCLVLPSFQSRSSQVKHNLSLFLSRMSQTHPFPSPPARYLYLLIRGPRYPPVHKQIA